MRHYGKVDKYQVAQAGYPYTESQHKINLLPKELNLEEKKGKKKIFKINSLL